MNIKSKDIKCKFTWYFLLFIVINFVVLWILQVVFLQACYKIMITAEVINIGNNIKESIENEDKLDEISFRNSFSIIITNSRGKVEYCSTSDGIFYIDFEQAKTNLRLSNKEFATYTVNIPKLKSSVIIYISEANGHYVMVSTNVEPIEATSKVISTQLIYITCILLIISIIIAGIIAKKLANPIVKMTEKAKELGKGNYDVEFETNTDYVEINKLAETLNYTSKELKKTDDLRKELIANVSHDIKTPLAIIKSYAEMIRDLSGENKVKREEHLDVIINQTDLLTKLTDDMMNLSKLETNTAEINIQKYDLKEQIEAVLSGFKCFKEYSFKFEYDEKKDYLVLADEVKINQVLFNLISNAVNYVGEDKTIYIKVTDASKDFFKVEVKDNGIGMEDTTHIFDRYYKSNDKFRKSGYGTGLGLSIVKNILQLHNFKYGVNSKLNEGTIFYFEIKKIYLNK